MLVALAATSPSSPLSPSPWSQWLPSWWASGKCWHAWEPSDYADWWGFSNSIIIIIIIIIILSPSSSSPAICKSLSGKKKKNLRVIQNQFHHLIFPNLLLLRESSCWKQFSIFSPFKTFDKYAFWLLDLFAVLSIVIGGDIETPGRQARDIRSTTHINTLEILRVLKLSIWICAFFVSTSHVCSNDKVQV